MEKIYIANYTDRNSGSSWDLLINAKTLKDATKEARRQQYGLMAGCKLECVHIKK